MIELVPLEQLAKGPAPTIERLRAIGATIAGVELSPDVVAQVDQADAAERATLELLKRSVERERGPMHLETFPHESAADAIAARVGVIIAALRHVEARCPHAQWPPLPSDARRLAVVLACRAVACGRPACIAALHKRWTDDGLCELCERPAPAFWPHIAPIGPLVVNLELCEACTRFMRPGSELRLRA